MKTIQLTRGWVTKVDDADFKFLDQWKWCAHGEGYAYRNGGEGRRSTMMHRVITNAPKGMDVDHINRDKLDNRRSNLRIVERWANNLNSPRKSMGYEKVSAKLSTPNKYIVRYFYNKKRIYVGYALNKKEAKAMYRNSVIELVPREDWKLMGVSH